VAVILFSLGYIGNDIINGRLGGRKISLSSIDNELGRREKEYKTLVNFKTEEVKSFSGSDDIIIKQLFDEIKKLDAVYDQSIKDLKELGPDEKVINTIFSTYEQKIKLLEMIIIETNKISRHENDEKTIL
jgi:archaellum component FlaC